MISSFCILECLIFCNVYNFYIKSTKTDLMISSTSTENLVKMIIYRTIILIKLGLVNKTLVVSRQRPSHFPLLTESNFPTTLFEINMNINKNNYLHLSPSPHLAKRIPKRMFLNIVVFKIA